VHDPLNDIKGPATGLIVVGTVNGIIALLTLLSGIVRLTGILDPNGLPTNEAERIGFILGTVVGYGLAFLGLIAAPVIAFGGYRMLSGRSYRMARASAVLAVIPLISCCFIAGIPVGLWALKVLGRPDVRQFFEGGGRVLHEPPLPPRF
jgi:hypothetical protein